MGHEFRIFGPPGTGKTTRLATRDIPRAVERFGHDGVMVTSFTRAAAREIASRGIEVNPENVGTLHALCYHALGRPELTQKHLDQWAEYEPRYALTGKLKGSLDQGGSDEAVSVDHENDQLFAYIQVLRAQRKNPSESRNIHVRRFHERWTQWKYDTGYADFTDLLEQAHAQFKTAPGDPRVIFVDEAQDNTPLMLSLLRQWGNHADWFVFCGDDDQTLYRFTGADPAAFLEPLPEEYQTTLGQSFRVPASVHRQAIRLISRIAASKRQKKDYLPRLEEGFFTRRPDNWKNPFDLVDEARSYVAQGKTVAFLASCSYLLAPVIGEMRRRGIPFHNPYRTNRGDWNPLRRGARGRVSSADVVEAFLSVCPDGDWTVEQLLTWAPQILVSDTGLVRGVGKKTLKLLEQAVKDGQEGLHTCHGVIDGVLSPHAKHAAIKRDLRWLGDNVVGPRQKSILYPLQVARQGGVGLLQEEPRITVGTIHSVKGGEADVVFLFPDLSRASWLKAVVEGDRDEMDSLYRLFYVGLTRAREGVVVCSPHVQFRGNGTAFSMAMEV